MVITKQSCYYDEVSVPAGIASFNEGKLELDRAWRGKLAKKKGGGGGGGGGDYEALQRFQQPMKL